ncbi:hypothetical protein CSOJ01_15675 [Colletotrichum sojae]|uniref:Uncharacterized protein n=1 Tax=Colletotrichum sojae TaxID=2175907 RepID=A0A8H6ILR4_9PEZI|nr:hypothetical protein CSOJ01_15675 [Colletotrichum sojae]
MKRVNGLILEFLRFEAPYAVTHRSTDSWDILLYRLMRSLRCQLGSNILPNDGNEYEWLDTTSPSRKAPYVDWAGLWENAPKNDDALDDDEARESDNTREKRVSSLLVHLETVAYWKLDLQATSMSSFEEAWNRNPFLVDFATSWDVELTFDAILTIEERILVDDCYFKVDNTPGEERGFTVNVGPGQINLLYVCGADKTYQEWDANLATDDPLLADRCLWSAIRTSGTEHTIDSEEMPEATKELPMQVPCETSQARRWSLRTMIKSFKIQLMGPNGEEILGSATPIGSPQAAEKDETNAAHDSEGGTSTPSLTSFSS